MRYPPEHKQRTRRRILKAAARRFRRQGFERTGIDRVMSDAGLTVGGFYSHFESKEALLAQVLDETVVETRRQLMGGLSELPPEERLQEIVRRYLSRQHRDQREAGCALPGLAAEVSRCSPRTRKVLGRYLEDLVTELEEAAPETRRARAAGPGPGHPLALCGSPAAVASRQRPRAVRPDPDGGPAGQPRHG